MFKRIKQFVDSPTGYVLAKGGSIVLLFKVVGALGGYVLLYSLGLAGGEAAIGIYEVAYTIVIIGSALSRWGLDTVIVREMARDQHSGLASRALYLSILKRVIILSIGWTIVVFTASSLLTNLFFKDTSANVLTTAAFSIIPFTLMLLNAEVFRAMGKSLLFSINQHGTIYVLIGILIAFVPFPKEYTAASTAQITLL